MMKTQKWIMLMMVAALFVAGCEKRDPAKSAKETDNKTPAPAAKADPAAPAGQVALKIMLPQERFDGTPLSPKDEPNMEERKPRGYRRPQFYVPIGTVNLSQGKTVTASEEPFVGELKQIVDGNAELTDETTLDLHSGPVWVTIDLGKECEIFAVLMWHLDRGVIEIAMRDVIVETADDKDFTTNHHILFNNDHNGSLKKGHGKGSDKQYLETYEGKLVDAKGTKGRYVRFWSNGNTWDDYTYWIEAMVFGRAVK
ncbi:MAG: hypothetical protein HN370_00345 [Phycisphaerales bacterium]|jgi:hypothetical protein|nr:hypothetical protein [Phycisphaerales bacterium]